MNRLQAVLLLFPLDVPLPLTLGHAEAGILKSRGIEYTFSWDQMSQNREIMLNFNALLIWHEFAMEQLLTLH